MHILFMCFVLKIISNYVVLKGSSDSSRKEEVSERLYYQFVYLAKFCMGYLLLKCFNAEFCDFATWFRLSVVGKEDVVSGGLNSLFTDIEFDSIIRLDSVISLATKYLNEDRATYLDYWYNNTSLLNGSLDSVCIGLQSEITYTGLCSIQSA